MALSDLFKGMQAGSDMYFGTEERANHLAKQRLGLWALEQTYADDQYLKPSELAERLAKYQYNEALANANASTLAKLRPLEDANKAAALVFETDKTGLAHNVFKDTYDTQYQTGVADAGNEYYKSSQLTPAQYAEQLGLAKMNEQKHRFNYQADNQTYPDRITTAMNAADKEAIEAGIAAGEANITRDYWVNNRDDWRNFVENKNKAAQSVADTVKINALSANEQALAIQKLGEIEQAVTIAALNGRGSDEVLQQYTNTNDPVVQNALTLYRHQQEQYKREQAAAALKAGGKTAASTNNPLIPMLLSDPGKAYEALTQKKVSQDGEGGYFVNGQAYTREQLVSEIVQLGNIDVGEFNKLQKDWQANYPNTDMVGNPIHPKATSFPTAVNNMLYNSGFQYQDDTGLFKLDKDGNKIYATDADKEKAQQLFRAYIQSFIIARKRFVIIGSVQGV